MRRAPPLFQGQGWIIVLLLVVSGITALNGSLRLSRVVARMHRPAILARNHSYAECGSVVATWPLSPMRVIYFPGRYASAICLKDCLTICHAPASSLNADFQK